jgi:hypothetical protein
MNGEDEKKKGWGIREKRGSERVLRNLRGGLSGVSDMVEITRSQ